MKSTGIVRKLDQLGRIVIPKELRKVLDINERDPLEIFINEELIVLKKYYVKNACIVTGEISDENKEYAPGLILSPRGAEMVLNMLMQETK
ncbi:AbrB/MazE/SpoVT family DNA-binding domain-containing protein (plasmid) [Planococcus glaciei]|uniref:AbrB/MazE/SpoVT family DNA-binding domain-containing protein n=1 Tax=Planococcus glaciei TaxID=459472 RepID=A0A7H8QH29_9BACL|nr:AbrB/MazE/SpoVT family DNA-binding domain-containing protein [Planococcus glaciei]QDY46974.1 AbrB/MazE/SpoVT family DNA-binding domain-containing protein [Planococcus glaciei]QKX52851.1 AbrB/MazE/SpoVT family DNA-binding domain-containing protein [Planococcus glaciei]